MTIGLAAALFVMLLLKHHPVGQRFEFDSLDVWFNLRPPSASQRVAVVAIDEDTVRRWNGRAFNGRDMARLLRTLKGARTSSVSLAIPSLSGPRKSGGAILSREDVDALIPALRQSGAVVLPLLARSQSTPAGDSILSASAQEKWGTPSNGSLSAQDFPPVRGVEGPPQVWIEQAQSVGTRPSGWTPMAARALRGRGSPGTGGSTLRSRLQPPRRTEGAISNSLWFAPGQPLLLDFSPLDSPQAPTVVTSATSPKGPVLERLNHFLQRGLDFAPSRARPLGSDFNPSESAASTSATAASASDARPAKTPLVPPSTSSAAGSSQVLEASQGRGFVRVSVARLLDNPSAAQVLEGKHVVVCITARELATSYFAPDGRRVLEGELHALALDNLLSGSILVEAPEIMPWVLAILSCVVVGGFVAARRTVWSAVVTLLCLLTIFVLSAGLFAQNVWLDITPPWLGIGLTYLTGVIGRARRDTREATRSASTVDALARAGGLLAAQTSSTAELLRRVLDWSVTTMEAEGGSALLLSEAGDRLLFTASVGPLAGKLEPFALKPGEGVAGWVAQHGESVFINDVRGDKRFLPDIDEATGFRTRSLACVPFKANGQTLGVLEIVNRKHNRPWEREDIELLESIAAQSALAIDNARLYHILNRRVQSSEESLEDANRRLEAERNLLSTVLHSMTDGVVVIDGREHVRMVNRAATKLLPELATAQNQELHQVLGEYPSEFVRLPEDRRGGRSALFTRGDVDAPRFIEARSSPLPRKANRDGERGEVIVFADVTEEKHIEQAKSDFVSFVAHEMRSPLTTISGFSSMLHRGEATAGEPNAQRLRFLGLIHDESERLKRLINSLLDVARIEAGRTIEISVDEWDFASVAQRAVESQRAYSSRHRIETLWPDGLPPVRADRDKVTQVLINLLSNAMKYSPGGVVTVSAQVLEGSKYLRCEVHDEGPGIPPEQQKRLFERFGRLSNPVGSGERAKPSGTGLGLFLSKHLIELQGGDMGVESQEGKGTTFWFTLPTLEAIEKRIEEARQAREA
jgi:signal transduction histidine kinase/CHASE2 domain-containing sensor protein